MNATSQPQDTQGPQVRRVDGQYGDSFVEAWVVEDGAQVSIGAHGTGSYVCLTREQLRAHALACLAVLVSTDPS